MQGMIIAIPKAINAFLIPFYRISCARGSQGKSDYEHQGELLRAAWGAPRTQPPDNIARRGRTGAFARGEAALGFIHLLTAAGMELL
jgi:hypothetical protein